MAWSKAMKLKFLRAGAQGCWQRRHELVLGYGPNVRDKRATAGHKARAGENVPRTARPGLVACRWSSA